MTHSIWIKLAILLVTSAGAVGLLAVVAGPAPLLDAFQHLDATYLTLAVAVSAFHAMMHVTRWWVALRAVDPEAPLRLALTSTLASWPLSVVTPSNAGDLSRGLFVSRRVSASAAVGAALVDKVVHLHTALLLALAAAVGFQQARFVAVAAVGVVGVWSGVAVLQWARLPLALTRRLPKVVELVSAVRSMGRQPARFLAMHAASLATWAASGLLLVVLLRAASFPVPALAIVGAWPLAVVVGMAPVTVSGIGTRDVAFLLLLGRMVTDLDAHGRAAVVSSTLMHTVLGNWLVAVVGLPFLMRAASEAREARSLVP